MHDSSPVRGQGATRTPTRRQRIIVAFCIATVAAVFPLMEHVRLPNRPSDFGLVWFGARSLLSGVNPYVLVGPGLAFNWDWRELLYPATSFVLATPLSWLPEYIAAATFVWISAGLLAYGVSATGWHRLFLFPSSAFIVAARAAQWSTLFSAAFCLPWLAFVLCAKPNLGLAIALASPSRRLLKTAIAGGIVLSIVSLLLFPTWPRWWLAALSGSHVLVPLLRPGGIIILLALLRWKRPEARLVVFLACMPQTGSWYEALPLLLVGQSRRECQLLSLTSSMGYLLILALIHGQPEAQFNREVSSLMVAFAYLPATIAVLRKPNEGELPAWLPRRLVRSWTDRFRPVHNATR